MKILFLVNELLIVCGVSKHFYHLLSGLKEYYPKNEYFVICGGGDAIEKFKSLDVPIFVNENIKHETRSVNGYLKGMYDIYKFVRVNKIDVIHSHHHYAASIASKSAKFTKAVTVLTNHGLLPEIGLLNHFSADFIITLNEYVLEYIVNNKIKSQERVVLIRLGFPFREVNKKRNEKLKVISGGRLVPEKGFDLYLKAVAQLDESLKNKAEFFLAGSGSECENLMKMNSGLSSNVKYIGEVENFQDYLINTDIFLMPSRIRNEGFPTVLIEAGLAKNLIITSNFRGLSYVVSPNEALIFSIGNFDELVVALVDAIENYEKFKGKMERMNNLVREKFSLSDMVHKTNKLYKSIMINQ